MCAMPDNRVSTATTSVPLLDVTRANDPLHDELMQAIDQVIRSGRFLHGPAVQTFEQSMARLCEVDHGVSCASGSDALLLALMACEIGPGDEVILPSFTFFATASCVWRLGAKPVFVDIEPESFNVDPLEIAKAITHRTKAIIPVHLFGQAARIDEICELAREHKLHVIEDAAQAIGARYAGRPVGGWGDIGCFSFYPTKNLGGFGDGGMLTAQDAALADRLRLLAGHGMSPRYYHSRVGINSRLDAIQAAVLQVKLGQLELQTAKRRANAQRYCQLITRGGVDASVILPATSPHCDHVWNQFTIRVQLQRDALRAALQTAGIGTEIYYPVPLHRQQCFRALAYQQGSLPETELAAEQVLSLPIFPELRADEQQAVVNQLASFCQTDLKSAA